jgi:hypothetical protein
MIQKILQILLRTTSGLYLCPRSAALLARMTSPLVTTLEMWQRLRNALTRFRLLLKASLRLWFPPLRSRLPLLTLLLA